MADWDAYFEKAAPTTSTAPAANNWDAYFEKAAPSAPAEPTSDAQDWVRSELFPIKRNVKTGEIKAAYPGFVKDFTATVKAAEEAPQAYYPATGEVHSSPEAISAGMQGAALATPLAPEFGAGKVAATEVKAGLKGQAAAKLETAKQSGLEFPATNIAPVMSDIRSNLKTMGYDRLTHKSVSTALSHVDRLLAKTTTTPEVEAQLEGMGSPFGGLSPKAKAIIRLETMATGPGHTFQDIHNAITNINPAIKAGGTQEKMGEMIRNKLDDYVFNLPKGPEFQQGMAEYSQARKLDTINEIKERVENATKGNVTRAGVAHNLAKEFRKIADNPKKLRLWKPDEQQAIKTITRKGNSAQWIAGKIGQFAPTGIGRIGIDVVIGHILGGLIPGGTYGLMAIGGVARGVETALARKRLTQFENLVSSGGDKSVFNALRQHSGTGQAIANWANTGNRVATRTLAVSIAKRLNAPHLIPRIEQELERIKE